MWQWRFNANVVSLYRLTVNIPIPQQFYYRVIIRIYRKFRHRYRGITVNTVPNPAITMVTVIKSNPITVVLPRLPR